MVTHNENPKVVGPLNKINYETLAWRVVGVCSQIEVRKIALTKQANWLVVKSKTEVIKYFISTTS